MKRKYRILIWVYEEGDYIKCVDTFEAESEEEALRMAEEDYPSSNYQVVGQER